MINFSDDDDIEEITKNNARDLLDQDEDYDEIEELNILHKKSQSDINFDALFSHARNDHDDSSCSRNSGQHVDKDSNAENDFKIFMYLEDKNENGDESQESPREAAGKDKQVQVEKRLENLFKREVPLTNIYYEKEGEASNSTVKVTTSEPTNYFSTDMGNL